MSAVDKAKHAADEAAGKAKEAVGKVTGDRHTEKHAKREQAVADLKQAGEKVKDAFKH